MNILITGASSGIGKDVAILYAQEPTNRIFACGRSYTRLQSLVESSNNISPLYFDLTDKSAIEKVSEQVDDIDLLILNAGDCEYVDDVLNFEAELFERVIQTNLISIGYCLKNWLPKMNKGGRVVFVSSSVTYLPFPRAQAYGASKAGMSYLANSLRVDLAKHDIHVSLVEPGFVKTPLTDKNEFQMPMLISSEEAADQIVKGIGKERDRICFPTLFILLLRLFQKLPARIWQKMVTSAN